MVEIAKTLVGQVLHPSEILRGVETLDGLAVGKHRGAQLDPRVQPLSGKALPKGMEAVRPEGVTFAETVTGELLARVDANRGSSGHRKRGDLPVADGITRLRARR